MPPRQRGVARPKLHDDPTWREQTFGPNDQLHVLGELPDALHCPNPKCGYELTDQDMSNVETDDGVFYCPKCRGNYQLFDPGDFGPGGTTISTLSLRQVGSLGEAIIREMGAIPGLGRITEDLSHLGTSGSSGENAPDFVVAGDDGVFYAVEVKANDARAQERFKMGGMVERQKKYQWAIERGYKPILVGVRLNFYNDQAQVFVQPHGYKDTWYGSRNLQHAATVSFADKNPFKHPSEQPEPEQTWGDPFEDPFPPGAAFARTATTDRLSVTAVHPQNELPVRDPEGKHIATIRRCANCGNTYWEKERRVLECPTCGAHTRTRVAHTKIVLAGPSVDQIAREWGWAFDGYTKSGERVYRWTDEHGVGHKVQVGSGAHGKGAAEIDAQKGRARMRNCMKGNCTHGPSEDLGIEEGQVAAPVIRAGQEVIYGGKRWWVSEIEGGLVAIYDPFGTQDVVSIDQLRMAMAYDPETWSLPEGMQIVKTPTGNETQQVEAVFPDGTGIGYLSWWGDTIHDVHVSPPYQRLGVASALLAEAERIAGHKIKHSDDLSPEGAAWMSADPEASRRVDVEDPRIFAKTAAVGDTFAIGDRVLGTTDDGMKMGTIMAIPPEREGYERGSGYYSVQWDDGSVNSMTWGMLKLVQTAEEPGTDRWGETFPSDWKLAKWVHAGDEPVWWQGQLYGRLSILHHPETGQTMIGQPGDHHSDAYARHTGVDPLRNIDHYSQFNQIDVNYSLNPATKQVVDANVLGYVPPGEERNLLAQVHDAVGEWIASREDWAAFQQGAGEMTALGKTAADSFAVMNLLDNAETMFGRGLMPEQRAAILDFYDQPTNANWATIRRYIISPPMRTLWQAAADFIPTLSDAAQTPRPEVVTMVLERELNVTLPEHWGHSASVRSPEPVSGVGSAWTWHRASDEEDAGETPTERWAYYRGKLIVEEWHHNDSFKDLLERMLAQYGYQDLSDEDAVDWDDVAGGLIYPGGRVEHEHLAPEETQERANEALREWRDSVNTWEPEVHEVEWRHV